MSLTNSQIISNLNPTPEPAVPRADPDNGMGQDAFLKLLLTQLQNQDPLDPMEGVEFTAQLAQFSSLEQLFNLNDSFQGVNQSLQAQNNFQAIDLVGKEVLAAGNVMSVRGGESTSAELILGEAAADGVLQVYTEQGSLVRTIDLGPMMPGEHTVEWDGENQNGVKMGDGNYIFQAQAFDANNNPIQVESFVRGAVSGVAFDLSEKPMLLINNVRVPMDEVLEVVSPAPAAAASTHDDEF